MNTPTPFPILGAIAVLPYQGRVLLVQRKNPPNAGTWGFPGGKVDWGETASAAALRELSEETGVRAVAQSHLTTLDAIARDDAGAVLYHYVLVATLCRYESGVPVAADDAEQADWFTPDATRTLHKSPQVDDVLALLHPEFLT